MAKFITLRDEFKAGALDTSKWTQFTAGSATMSYDGTGATVTYPASSTSSTDGDLTSGTFDLTGSYAYLQVLAVPSSLTFADAELRLKIDGNNWLRWLYEGGTLYAQKNVATVKTTVTSFTFNATTHKWWRISELNGNTYWDTSTDGVNWVNQASASNGIAVTSLAALLAGTCFENETNPGSFKFSNFNTGLLARLPNVRNAIQNDVLRPAPFKPGLAR